MTWIETRDPNTDRGALNEAHQKQRALYPKEYAVPTAPANSGPAGIVASHSLLPDTLYHAFATYGTLLSPDLPLERRHHEMIATVVSVTNRCRYWLQAHAEFLRRVTLDESLVEQLRSDYRGAPITAAERAMLDFSVQITEDATRITRRDVDGLRTHGFDDRAILQITLIASWFNYINRVADALGVGRDDPAGNSLPVPPEAPWA